MTLEHTASWVSVHDTNITGPCSGIGFTTGIVPKTCIVKPRFLGGIGGIGTFDHPQYSVQLLWFYQHLTRLRTFGRPDHTAGFHQIHQTPSLGKTNT